MLMRCLLVVMCLAVATACGGVDRQTFSELDRAGRALVVAFESKPNLSAFRALHQKFAAALGTAKPRAQSSGDRTQLSDYEAVDALLREMLVLWAGRDEHDAELLPVADELPGRLLKRYDLPVNTNEPTSIYASEALRALRDDVTKRLATASGRLKP